MALAALGIRAALVVVLGAAAVSKLRNRAGFHGYVKSLRDSDLVPNQFLVPVAVGLLVLEASGAVLLIIPSEAQVGLSVAVALMLLLTFGAAAIVITRRSVLCNCFGAGGSLISGRHIVRNAFLGVLAATGLAVSAISHGLPGDGKSALLAIITGALVGACVVAWDDVAFVLVGAPT
jgi:Methylamine utilisation protein MauE